MATAAAAATSPRAPQAVPQPVSPAVSQPAQLPQPGPSPSAAPPKNHHGIPRERSQDSYAIYSLLMPGKLFEHLRGESASRWAIAQKTITFDQMDPRIDPRGALQPPPGNEKAFHQAVRDFEASRSSSYTLQPHLRLNRPYSLLNPAQVRELRDAKSAPAPDSRLQARYAAYPGITFFSAVYFSQDQKAALVYVNDWCGVLCSQGQWVYLEKRNGRWERMSGITVPGA